MARLAMLGAIVGGGTVGAMSVVAGLAGAGPGSPSAWRSDTIKA
jgi:hypothetical protein